MHSLILMRLSIAILRQRPKQVASERFKGDRVLANTINFTVDTIVVREFLYAVSEGDVGRVYEAMKVSHH